MCEKYSKDSAAVLKNVFKQFLNLNNFYGLVLEAFFFNILLDLPDQILYLY